MKKKRRLVYVAPVVLSIVAYPLATRSIERAPSAAAVSSFVETFDGAPATPTAWNGTNWDVTVHSRDRLNDLHLVNAHHGPDCSAPLATHPVTKYEDAVFQCKDHVMTSLQDDNYGALYLTPNHLADFSSGTATIKFDLSTLQVNGRDWWDLWLTPYDTALQTPLDGGVDFQGPPRDAIHMRVIDNAGHIRVQQFRNFQTVALDSSNVSYNDVLVPDAARRDTFQVDISQTHIKVWMPKYNLVWLDRDFPQPLSFSSSVVQFGHHSYNPNKDGCAQLPCGGTFHWDNVSISPSIPFTMIEADSRTATPVDSTVNFAAPAPANSNLRFNGLGRSIEVSFDAGRTWRPAVRSLASMSVEEHFDSYWTPVPQGTNEVVFRGAPTGYGADWHVRNISIWSDT